MSAILKLALLEFFKASLMFVFGEMRRAGLTAEEMKTLYNETRAEFLANDPANIPGV